MDKLVNSLFQNCTVLQNSHAHIRFLNFVSLVVVGGRSHFLSDEAFTDQKHQTVCFGQILTENDVKYLNREFVFSPPSSDEINTNVTHTFRHNFTRTLHPKYVLIILATIAENSMNNYIVVPEHFISSILLVFYLNNPDLCYVGCFTCDKTHLLNKSLHNTIEEYNNARNTAVLIETAFDKLSPSTVDSLWKHLHLKINNFGITNLTPDSDSELDKCSRSKMYELTSQTYLERNIEQMCVLEAYKIFRNCTSFQCSIYLSTVLFYQEVFYWQFHFNNNGYNMEYRVLSTGAQYSGLLFSVVIEPTVLHADYFALLQPFLVEVWVLVGICMGIISCVITGTGLKCHVTIIWIFSILLEQGNILFKRTNVQVRFLVMWLFGSFVIRQYYSSFLFSYITSPKPLVVPKTWSDLYHYKTKVFADSFLALHLNYQYESLNESFGSIGKEYNLFNITNVFQSSVHEIISQFLEKGSITCSNLNFYLSIKEEEIQDCDMSKRFAILYNTHGNRSPNTARFALPAIAIFGGRSIVTTQQQSGLFLQPSLWFSTTYQYFLDDYQTFVGVMVENGLSSIYKQTFETTLQGKILKEVDVNGGFERNWNYFTYATELMKNGNVKGLKKLTINLKDIWVVFSMLFWSMFACSLRFVYEILGKMQKN